MGRLEKTNMKIVHWGYAKRFYRLHRFAEAPLRVWKTKVQEASWENFSDIRQTFSNADWIGGRIVFNIAGNHYRLIAIANFKEQRLYICQVMTHEEYSQKNWKK